MSPSLNNVGDRVSHAGQAVVPAWKKELNERLAATRSRRTRNVMEQVPLPGLEHLSQKVDSRAARLAAKVAQRYANAPSYSDLLAARADISQPEAEAVATEAPAAERPLPVAWSGPLTSEEVDLVLASAPEEVILPAVKDTVEPLPVNLIAIPRELVAPRKVRPRLAEGPLRTDSEDALVSVSQAVILSSAAADWSGIRLDVSPAPPALATAVPFKIAPLEDRLMACIFDLSLIVAAFAVFILVFAACTAHPPTGKPAWIAGSLVFGGFAWLYHYLFFKYADATPGMRYAKIALCTFDDDNPTRKAMCRRLWFVMISAAPLGLGFLWACLDPERLSWHDRLSRMYQRSYS